MARRLAVSFAILAALGTSAGCAFLQPALGALLSRLDVGRVIACAQMATPEAKARCVGAQAMTAGLDAALSDAARLGELAIDKANRGAGAEISPAESRAIARDLDRALNALAAEIDATHE